MSRDLNFHNIWKHRSAFKWYDQSILVNWWDFIWKICRNCETRKIQKVWYHLRGGMDNNLLLHKCSYCPPLLPPSPPFPLIPFLWPLYPSCNISSKNIPPVFCCAFHVYGKPTNFDLKFMRVSFTGKISKQLPVVPLAPRFCKQHLLLQSAEPRLL